MRGGRGGEGRGRARQSGERDELGRVRTPETID